MLQNIRTHRKGGKKPINIKHTELFIWKSRALKVLNSYHDRNPSTTFDVANFDEFVESNKDLIFSGVKLFTV